MNCKAPSFLLPQEAGEERGQELGRLPGEEDPNGLDSEGDLEPQ